MKVKVKVKVKFRLNIENWRERKVKMLEKRQVVSPEGEPRLESVVLSYCRLQRLGRQKGSYLLLIGCSYPAGQTSFRKRCKGMRRSKNNETEVIEVQYREQ